MNVMDIPLVIGAPGTRPMKLRYWLKEIGIDNRVADNCHPRHCSNPPKGS